MIASGQSYLAEILRSHDPIASRWFLAVLTKARVLVRLRFRVGKLRVAKREWRRCDGARIFIRSINWVRTQPPERQHARRL
ncbi:hypothetical protein BFN67_08955 [Pseudaminobacter manganicus]|uniref:Transposase DDE domain-containing protein n=1 Tax=Manganibacter manganicus TaxID=1873176 RepID=A0A1V8RJM0_9HYPH|nr:hypothetical protein BFN67_08955 [Pseudaminobacter manganicus]